MLHRETIDDSTFALLKTLQSLPILQDFYLVGGTALALQLGHRKSIDLDLFTTTEFDAAAVLLELEKIFGAGFTYEGGVQKFGIFCFINNIKVDIVHYPHSIVFAPAKDDTIKMYAAKEIAAMKVQAIYGRGTKKDFWDMAALLNHFSLKEIISFFEKKYPSNQILLSVPQALVYFVDAEASPEPVSLNNESWESIKSHIRESVRNYLS